jgi:hypothetical protein
MMKTLTLKQAEEVNGGIRAIGSFIIGYAASKALDVVVDNIVESGAEWAESVSESPRPTLPPGAGFGTI